MEHPVNTRDRRNEYRYLLRQIVSFLESDRFILININSSDHTGKVMSGGGDRKIEGTDS